MKSINVMEVVCMRSKNKTKAGYGYYIDKTSIYTDEDRDTFGDCYNEKGVWVGRVNLNRFKTTIPNLNISIKEE